jgi:hypothetical protein
MEMRNHPGYANLHATVDGRIFNEKNQRFIGSQEKRSNRFVVLIDNHKKYRYRLIFEAWNNRLLEKGEEVDHINFDCADDKPENLQALTRAEHNRKTAQQPNAVERYRKTKQAKSFPVRATGPNGQVLQFPSLTDAAKHFKSHSNTMGRAVRHGRPLRKGLLAGWSFIRLDDKMAEPQADLPDETWNPVTAKPKWQVSNMGRVKFFNGRVGRGTINSQVRQTSNLYVHRLVCEAFHGPPPAADSQVDHVDGDSLNNRADNLEWVTQRENVTRACGKRRRGE